MSDAKIAVLETKVETLEEWAAKHELDDQRSHKYQNNMMEDLIARLAGIERSAARFETDLMHRNGSDVDTKASLRDIFERIRVLERLVWIAMGAVVVVGGIVSIVGGNILKIIGVGYP